MDFCSMVKWAFISIGRGDQRDCLQPLISYAYDVNLRGQVDNETQLSKQYAQIKLSKRS